MELRNARLCLDCEEVHDAEQCPVCGSDMFSFIMRWVPAAVARKPRPRPTTSEEAEIFRRLIAPEPTSSRGGRLLKQGALGLTALGIASVFWGSRGARKSEPKPAAPPATPAESEEV